MPKPNKYHNKKTASEHAEQVALINWTVYAQNQLPELGLLYAIPNGGKRDVITAAKLKAEGVKAGVPDLCLPVARGGFHGLYIELKAGKNKPTENQKEWLNALRGQNYAAEVCVGWEQAKECVLKYLEIKGEV